MQPERLPEQTPGATADHRRAELACGNDAEPRGRPGRQSFPVGDQATGDQPLALLPGFREIAPAFQAHRPGKAQRRPWCGHRRIRPGSGACVRRGGDFARWPARSGWSSGSKSRAAVCGGSSTVGTGVSCDDSVLVEAVKTTLPGHRTGAPDSPCFTEGESLSVKGGVSRMGETRTAAAHPPLCAGKIHCSRRARRRGFAGS